MEKLPYETPSIVKHTNLLANKFGKSPSRRTLSHIDGVSVAELMERHGSPLFIFSEKRIRARIREAKRAFGTRYPKVQFSWSYKTNYLDAICRIFHDEGSFAEVVSEMEYEMALRLQMPPERILFNGPYKPTHILKRALQDGARVHIDHMDELYDAERVAEEAGQQYEVTLRLNMDTGIYPRWDRFGFNLDNGDAMSAVQRIVAGGKLRVTGLHCHIGTYVMEPNAYNIAATKVAALARRIEDETGTPIATLDLGGGFASPATLHDQYSPGVDTAPRMDDYAEAITDALLSAGFSPQRMPTLILETGRALIDEAGYMAASVVANKRLADGTRAMIIDAGVNALFTSFWYRHNISPVSDEGGIAETTVVYGPLCMNIDVVVPAVQLPHLAPGRAVVLHPVGAYNVTQWMQFITLRPAVVLIRDNGDAVIIRRRETIDDVKAPECP